MRHKTSMLASCILLIGLFMAACGNAQSIATQATSTIISASPTPQSSSSQPNPSSANPPSSAPHASPTAVTYGDLTGVWQGDDNAYYYIRQVGNAITWAGFSSDDGISYTNVLCATRAGTTITGAWADVPRGNQAGSGTLSLQIDTSNPNTVQIHKTAANAFGASNWHKVNISPSLSATMPQAKDSVANATDMTGDWNDGDDPNGIYYIRQVGSKLWWLGLSSDNGKSYANVFCGNRANNVIAGMWNDVPRGVGQSSGMLSLLYSYSAQGLTGTPLDDFVRTSETGGFGGSGWGRL